MKAWWVKQHGGIESLLLEEASAPVLSENMVRLKVLAVGLNHLDLWVRHGVPGHHFPLPIILGSDVVGEVVEFHPSAAEVLKTRGIQVGSRALLYPVNYCGGCVACKKGNEQECHRFSLLGESENGGLCEEMVVPASLLFSIPEHLSNVEAACLPVAGVTAWAMVRKARIQSGDWVLIQAAGSGVSSYAIQIAKSLGAKVISTVGSPDKLKRAQELGADYVFLYREKNIREEVKKLLQENSRPGLDAVIDHVGSDTFSDGIKLLAKGGRYVFCGATSGSRVSVDLNLLFFKNLSILGTTMGSPKDFESFIKSVGDKKINPVVDRSFSFTELPEAHTYLESRKGFGKTVICMS